MEQALGSQLAVDLRGLLNETDGVVGEDGVGVIWPSARIRDDNLHVRGSADLAALYMRFDSLLFFGDAGNGDQFAFRVLSNETGPDVYVWDHESDNRVWVARDLRGYIDGRLTGAIRV
jgi:hypothetical protein